MSQSVPGAGRRDKAGRPVRQVTDARTHRQTRSGAGCEERDDAAHSTAVQAAAARIARIAVAGGLTAYILWKSHPREVLAAAAGADWRPVAIAVLLVFLDRALMAYRWVVLLSTV